MTINEETDYITVQSNVIPDHKVGLFGDVAGALNPNAISAQNETYVVSATPQEAATTTELLGSNGPDYAFGVLLNGVLLDPIAAEPWPHERLRFSKCKLGMEPGRNDHKPWFRL